MDGQARYHVRGLILMLCHLFIDVYIMQVQGFTKEIQPKLGDYNDHLNILIHNTKEMLNPMNC